MKKCTLLVVCALLVFLASSALAKTVTLSWDASPSQDVVGYEVHYSISEAQPFTTTLDVGDVLTTEILDLEDGVGYYFSVSAYSAAGFTSVYSNVVYSPGFLVPEAPTSLGGVTSINNIDIPVE